MVCLYWYTAKLNSRYLKFCLISWNSNYKNDIVCGVFCEFKIYYSLVKCKFGLENCMI